MPDSGGLWGWEREQEKGVLWFMVVNSVQQSERSPKRWVVLENG